MSHRVIPFADFIFPQFFLGTGLVMFSVYLYSGPERKTRHRPPPISIVGYEKTTIDSTPRIEDEPAHLTLDQTDGLRVEAISSSRPTSPALHHARVHSARGKRFGA